MTMEWSSNKASFREHREYMREFRSAHAAVAWVNKPKCDELARLNNMLPLQVAHPTMVETEELRFQDGTTNWASLVPVLKVAQYKLSPN